MKSLENGDQKIQKLCDILRRETLEPAEKEAERLLLQTEERAAEILKEAEDHAEKILADARKAVEQERNVFYSSLEQAGRQSIESLKQSIEKELFQKELSLTIQKETAKPDVVAALVSAIVKAVEKEGVSADLSAVVAQNVSVDEVNRLIEGKILERLREGSVSIGHFKGGAQVKLHDKKMTIDITDIAVAELLAKHMGSSFRDLLFGKTKKES